MFGFDVFAIQANFVIRNIAFKLYAFIIALFLKLLGVMKTFTANLYEFLKLI